MLLNQGPSCRQRSRPQPVNQAQDLGELSSGDCDLCELNGDVAAMSHDLCTDFDQLLPQRGQRTSCGSTDFSFWLTTDSPAMSRVRLLCP